MGGFPDEPQARGWHAGDVSGSQNSPEALGGPDRLRIQSVPRADGAELRLSGELSLATISAFRDQLRDSEDAGPDLLVIDLRQLRFLDSLGIAELIAVDNRSRQVGRRFVLVTAAGTVTRVLAMTGLDRRLVIRDTPPELGEP